jgi:hypothetical protein
VKSSGYLDREWKAEQWLASQAGSRERKETLLPLLSPVTARVAASTSNFALDYGVEVRVPLLDRRVIDFAARRPREERASAGSVKHLLRAAAAGALPPEVLAPRATRTGTLGHYFARELRADRYGIVTDAFRDPVLADLGIVDKAQLSDAWIQYRASGDATVGARLFLTLQVELWLKSQPAVLQRSCTDPFNRVPDSSARLVFIALVSCYDLPCHCGRPGRSLAGDSRFSSPRRIDVSVTKARAFGNVPRSHFGRWCRSRC